MPTPQMKAYAEKYDVPLAEIEKFWKEAKAEYGEDWAKVSGTVKKMAKNYKKGKEKKNESFIDKSLNILVECGADGKCQCKEKGKCGGKCEGCKKCSKKKKKGFAAALTGDELAGMTEGATKKALEDKVEKACKCDGGSSLDPNDHDASCPAQKIISGASAGDEYDEADYKKGDR